MQPGEQLTSSLRVVLNHNEQTQHPDLLGDHTEGGN